MKLWIIVCVLLWIPCACVRTSGVHVSHRRSSNDTTCSGSPKKRRKVSYKHIPIPSKAAVLPWVKRLQDLNITTDAKQIEKGKLDNLNEEIGDITARFAMLAYARLNGEPVGYKFMSSDGETVDLVELQFLGDSLKNGDYKNAAHCVVYLYKLGVGDHPPSGGVGVVLAFKGSTNRADWMANFDAVGETKFREDQWSKSVCDAKPDDERCATTHPGFLSYQQTLAATFAKLRMNKLRQWLPDWHWGDVQAVDVLGNQGMKIKFDQETFKDWLQRGDTWAWCAVVGHSLGGALAVLSATDIAERAGRPTLLATFGQPVVGNHAFKNRAAKSVLPAGGLRFKNKGDWVTAIGHHGLSVHLKGDRSDHNGLAIELRSVYSNPLKAHTRFYFQSNICDKGVEAVEYAFPATTYKPNSETAFGDENMRDFHWCLTIIEGSCGLACPDGNVSETFTGNDKFAQAREDMCQKIGGCAKPRKLARQPHAGFCFYTAEKAGNCADICAFMDGIADVSGAIIASQRKDICDNLGSALGRYPAKCSYDQLVDSKMSLLGKLPRAVEVSAKKGRNRKKLGSQVVCSCRAPLWNCA